MLLHCLCICLALTPPAVLWPTLQRGCSHAPGALCSHHFSQLLFCCQAASADLEAFFPLPPASQV